MSDGPRPDPLGAGGPAEPDEGVVARLLRARAEAVARLAALRSGFDEIVEASAGSNADDEHDPEGATIAFERSQVDAAVRATRSRVEEIDAALARQDAGGYGRCETCGRAIPVERLEARPTARTCIACASGRG